MQTLGIFRRQDKGFSQELVWYEPFGKLGSIIFSFGILSSNTQKLLVPEEQSLVMPSCRAGCPYEPLGLLTFLFFSFLPSRPVLCLSGSLSGISRPESWLCHLSVFSHSEYFPEHFQTIFLFSVVVWLQSCFCCFEVKSSSTSALRGFLQQFCPWICSVSELKLVWLLKSTFCLQSQFMNRPPLPEAWGESDHEEEEGFPEKTDLSLLETSEKSHR